MACRQSCFEFGLGFSCNPHLVYTLLLFALNFPPKKSHGGKRTIISFLAIFWLWISFYFCCQENVFGHLLLVLFDCREILVFCSIPPPSSTSYGPCLEDWLQWFMSRFFDRPAGHPLDFVWPSFFFLQFVGDICLVCLMISGFLCFFLKMPTFFVFVVGAT